MVRGRLERITMQTGESLLVKSRGACFSGVSDKVVLVLVLLLLLLVVWWWWLVVEVQVKNPD